MPPERKKRISFHEKFCDMWAGDCFAGFVGFDFIHRNFKALLLKLLDNLFITSVTTFAANGKTVKKFFIMYVDIVSEYMDFNTMVICRNFKTGNSCQSVFVFGSSFWNSSIPATVSWSVRAMTTGLSFSVSFKALFTISVGEKVPSEAVEWICKSI